MNSYHFASANKECVERLFICERARVQISALSSYMMIQVSRALFSPSMQLLRYYLTVGYDSFLLSKYSYKLNYSLIISPFEAKQSGMLILPLNKLQINTC